MVPHIDFFARLSLHREPQTAKRKREGQPSVRLFGIDFPCEAFREELQAEGIEPRVQQHLYRYFRN